MSLNGRGCIVTGAGRGIGRATAVQLAAAGANVMAVARTARDLEETVALCLPGNCMAHVADVTRPEDLDALVSRCRAEFGSLNVLVNNAAIAPLASIEEMTPAQFDKLMRINVCSVFYACRAAWPALRESQGTIVNLSSLAAEDPFAGFAAYGATKAWVNTFTRALANEGKPLGIRVFGVAPGAVETRMLRTPFPDFPAEKTLQPDDVAGLIVWLLDDRCKHASGEIIRVRR